MSNLRKRKKSGIMSGQKRKTGECGMDQENRLDVEQIIGLLEIHDFKKLGIEGITLDDVRDSILKSKDFKLEANKLIEYLGGTANIINYEVNNSRFVVNLHNIELVNKEAIQKMGAQGIVEIDNQLKIIFGEDAKQLKKNIDDLK